MGSQQPLTPGYIKKFDQQLLKNNPVTWSTRIHMVLFYGLEFTLLISLLCFLVPDDARNNSRIGNWVTLLSIISFLAFIFWMIYLLRFNVFKRFGKWNKTDTVKTFLFYFFITLLIISWPFIPLIVQSARANAAYTSNELATDINNMNLKIALLERDSLDTKFHRDTFKLNNYIVGTQAKEYQREESDETLNKYGFYFVDSTVLQSKLLDADSITKINDSTYVIFECPDYIFIRHYLIDDHTTLKVMNSMNIYRQVFEGRPSFDKAKVEKELAPLLSKYNVPFTPGAVELTYETNSYDYNQLGRTKINRKYNLEYTNYRIQNIADKKYRWDYGTISMSWRIAYYITLSLALLVLIFRHTTRRTFFLSLLTSVVLCILTGLFLAMSYNGDGAFFNWLIIYFIILALMAATIISSKYRNVMSGIGLNLLVFLTPFMPMVITATYYAGLRSKYGHPDAQFKYLFENESRNYFISEIAGFVLLILFLTTIYQMAYRKWFASPEQ